MGDHFHGLGQNLPLGLDHDALLQRLGGVVRQDVHGLLQKDRAAVHLAGDQVLISVARTLVHSLRPSDMPVRYGGEEFTVFLPGTTTENAKVIAERIRSNMENMSVVLPDGNVIPVTVSIGFAERVDGDTVASLIERADQAVYQAKENGRNRVCQNLGGGKFNLL